MNRVQFLDSLRRQLDDLPSQKRDELVEVYSRHIQNSMDQGLSEREAVDWLGTPAACARDARAGRLPTTQTRQAATRKTSNPFEPQMAAKPQRVKAQKLDRERQRHPEEPQGKKPWTLVIIVTLAALICLAFVLLRVLSSDGKLGYAAREQSYPLDEVQHIVVEDVNKPIRVSALTHADVRVNYYEGHHERYELSLEDGTLYVKAVSDRKWYDTLLSFYDSTTPVLNLYLPPDFCGSLSLSTSNGNIEILGTLETADLTLHSSNGSISLTDTTVEGELQVVTTNAPIELNQVAAAGAVLLTNTNGSISLQDLDCTALQLQTSNGTVQTYELSERIETVEIETSNSSVLGSICGSENEFAIEAETTNSRSNLASRTGGSRRISIKTTNGVIDFEFIS